MADVWRKILPGQPTPNSARLWNHVVDAARDYRDRQQGGGAAELDYRLPEVGSVLVHNATGDDLNDVSVLAVTGAALAPGGTTDDPASDEFRRETLLECKAPSADNATNPFVVTLGPIPKDAIGRAVLWGAAKCQVQVQSEGDTTAGPIAGDTTKLTSGAGLPAIILSKPSGTGRLWCDVLLQVAPGAAAPIMARITSLPVQGPTSGGTFALSFPGGPTLSAVTFDYEPGYSCYAWEEVSWVPPTGAVVDNVHDGWVTAPGGRSGTATSDPAVAVGGDQSVPLGAVVELRTGRDGIRWFHDEDTGPIFAQIYSGGGVLRGTNDYFAYWWQEVEWVDGGSPATGPSGWQVKTHGRSGVGTDTTGAIPVSISQGPWIRGGVYMLFRGAAAGTGKRTWFFQPTMNLVTTTAIGGDFFATGARWVFGSGFTLADDGAGTISVDYSTPALTLVSGGSW